MASSRRCSRVRSPSEASDDSVVEIDSPAKKPKLSTPSATTSNTSTDYSWRPAEIVVGTHKEDRKVQIFAKLNRAENPVVLFKINVHTANKVSKIQFYNEKVIFDNIKFAPEFERDSAKETKEYIKTKFTRVVNPNLTVVKPDGNSTEEPIEDQHGEHSSSSDTESRQRDETRNPNRKRQAIFSDNPSSKRPHNARRKSSAGTKALSSLGDIYSTLDRHMLDVFRTARDAIEDIVINLESNANGQIAILKDLNKALELTITEHKRNFGSLNIPLPKSNNSRRAKPQATHFPLPGNASQPVAASHLDMRNFENVARRSNSGFMQEKKPRLVHYVGKWYEERIIVEELQEFKAPGEFYGTTQIDGRTFTTFRHQGGDFKYLEQPNPGLDSIVTADCGRKFVKWTLLKPLNYPDQIADELTESPRKTNSFYSDY